MKHLFSIELTTGALARLIDGAPLDAANNLLFTARDIMDCAVRFTVKGEDFTTDVLPAGAQLRLGLRANPSEGSILAQSTPHVMVDGRAQAILSLDTEEIVALIDTLATSARSVKVHFEVEVVGPDGAYRHTLCQIAVTLRCEVNMAGDAPQTIPFQILFTNPVAFPANSATPGAPGDYSFNGDELAFYVPGVGYRKVTLLGW